MPEIIEYEDRNYVVRFTALLSGVYEFSLTFNKYHIKGSPFKATIVKKPIELQQAAELTEPKSNENNESTGDENDELEHKSSDSRHRNKDYPRALTPITDLSEEGSDEDGN